MSTEASKKPQIVSAYQRHAKDTGSSEVQIALITERINHLTGHLKGHVKDHSSRRGLLKLVGKRSALLKYLAAHKRERYLDTIRKLGLRK